MSNIRSAMKSKFVICLILVGLFLGGYVFVTLFPFVHHKDIPLPIRPEFVAHGGGALPGIGGISNSEEALSHSFSTGYSLIEVDFHWTQDNELVLIHDWGWAFEKWFDCGDENVPTKSDFMNLEMKQDLTQMDLNDLLIWMESHEGVFIVTDVKKDNLRALHLIHEKSGDRFNRFIPQAYSINEFDVIKSIGFNKVILTLYRTKAWNFQLLRFVKKHPEIYAMTMRPQRAIRGKLGAMLKKRGVFVYAHTINDPNEFIEIQKHGISGIYTDYLFGHEKTKEILDLRER